MRRLAGTFNTMAGRLEALVHGHRAMMADVSHQLRTPLAALRLRLDLLAADADEATAAELAGAQEEIARLSRLVDGLLAVARAESVITEPVPVAVAGVIRDRVAAWAPVAEERAVLLSAAGPGQVRASLGEGHLEQILDNLIANALDAVPAGGHIRVSAQPGGQGALIAVADDGPGHEPRAAGGGVPPVRQQHLRRDRARPGDRAPARHVQRRVRRPVGHPGRRAHGDPRPARRAGRPGGRGGRRQGRDSLPDLNHC